MPLLNSDTIKDRRTNENIEQLLSSLMVKQNQQDKVIKDLIESSNKSIQLLIELSRNAIGNNDQKLVDVQQQMSKIANSIVGITEKVIQNKINLEPLVKAIEKNTLTENSIKSAFNSKQITDSIKEVNETIKTSSGKTWNFSVVRDSVGFIKEIKATQE